MELGLEKVLAASQNTLTSLHIEDCDHILTERYVSIKTSNNSTRDIERKYIMISSPSHEISIGDIQQMKYEC